MSEHADVLQGPTFPVRWEGKTYQLGMLDQDAKALYEQWCKEESYEELCRLELLAQEGKVKPEHFQRMFDRYSDRVLSHAFDWGAAAWQTYIDTHAGRAYLFFLSLHRRYKDFTREGARKLYDGLPHQETVRLMQFIINGPPPDPNAPAPAEDKPPAG